VARAPGLPPGEQAFFGSVSVLPARLVIFARRFVAAANAKLTRGDPDHREPLERGGEQRI